MRKNLIKRIFTSLYALSLVLTVVITTDNISSSFNNNYCLELEHSDESKMPPISILIDDKPQDDC